MMEEDGATTDVVATTDDSRSKHIEVCVRLRPLSIPKGVSSSSFFHSTKSTKPLPNFIPEQQHHHAAAAAVTTNPNTNSNVRKPAIPRFSSKLATPNSSLKKNTNNSATGSPETTTGPSTSNATAAAPVPVGDNNANTTTTTVNPLMYAWDVVDDDTVTQSPHTELIPGRTHTYTLDRVYGPQCATIDVYRHSVQDLVTAAMEGYHTAVLAYGQTSTGKTHTMTGTPNEPGLIPLAVRECFGYLKKNHTTGEDREYLLRVSYLEVYKEHIKDLLADPTTTAVVEPIRLYEHAEKGLIIRGLKEEVVTSPEQVFGILALGEARRQVGATHMNQHSSRSHVMVRIWIESRQRSTNHKGGTRVSSVSLVDLAGSESVRLTGSTERQAEGHYINKSLMTLGKVVYGLSETTKPGGTKKHVPYRDSKLTRLLQPSLSGNSQVVLVCCISPLVSHIEESHNTFKFAVRAKKIPQKAVIDDGTTSGDNMLQNYRDEIEDLKQQLREAQQQLLQNQTSLSTASLIPTADMQEEMMELVTAIRNMEKLILKTKSAEKRSNNEYEDDDDLLGLVDEHLQDRSMVLHNGPSNGNGDHNVVATPPPTGGGVAIVATEDLQSELSRIQSLLSTVLKKRTVHDETVRNLRAQLEEQEVTGTLRQADSSFLQKQLQEKDALLEEVSKLLEAVEEKQSRLEAENAALRQELARWKPKR